MTARGHYERSTLPGFEHLECYVPEPSVRVQEIVMGRAFAAEPCPTCRRPLDRTAAVTLRHRRYHRECVG